MAGEEGQVLNFCAKVFDYITNVSKMVVLSRGIRPCGSVPEWYLCQTKSGDEETARVNLERQGYRVHLPRLDDEPPFPGYLFVAVDERPFAPIDSTRGVIRLVRFGDRLATVPQSIVKKFERIQWVHEELPEGSEVIINSGPFNHIRGIVKAKRRDRIVILLTLLNQPQEVEFPMTDVVAA